MMVDVAFGLAGPAIPADHSFALFGAISRILPEVHAEPALGIHPISGRPLGGRRLGLTRASTLRIRVPLERVSLVLPLAGKKLDVDGDVVKIGIASIEMLRPAATLESRLVVIKGFMTESEFLDAAQRQLDAMPSRGRVSLIPVRNPRAAEGRTARLPNEFVRRTLSIHGRHEPY